MKATVIAIANLKGGVGKTTTALSFGAELARKGFKVLLVDADDNNQSLTGTLGAGKDQKRKSLTNLLMYSCFEEELNEEQILGLLIRCEEGFDLLPSDQKLAGISSYLSHESQEGNGGALYHMRSIIEKIRDRYEYIIIDTGANFNTILLNVFTAADEVIIPAQAQKMSDNGTMETLSSIAKNDTKSSANRSICSAGRSPLTTYS